MNYSQHVQLQCELDRKSTDMLAMLESVGRIGTREFPVDPLYHLKAYYLTRYED